MISASDKNISPHITTCCKVKKTYHCRVFVSITPLLAKYTIMCIWISCLYPSVWCKTEQSSHSSRPLVLLFGLSGKQNPFCTLLQKPTLVVITLDTIIRVTDNSNFLSATVRVKQTLLSISHSYFTCVFCHAVIRVITFLITNLIVVIVHCSKRQQKIKYNKK